MPPSHSTLSPQEHHKVIVLGAGFNGISAAKTYLEIDPLVDLLVVDGDSSIGGVWSASRIYPGLTYEIPAPLANFSEMDMCKELDIEPWSDISGYQVHEYLVRYAKKFDVLRRCRLKTHVELIEKDGSSWKLLARGTGKESANFNTLTCDKLIISTGVASKPRMPDLDLSNFDGFHFHAKEMGQRHQELVADSVKHVTIIGGHKSALEAVGTCAQAGKKVEWLIRADGGGPTWMMPAKNPKTGESVAKVAPKRFLSMLTTSIYKHDRWINRFFYNGNLLGSCFISWVWGNMTKMMQGDRYTKSENGKKLKPYSETLFWMVPGGTSVHDRDSKTLELIDEGELVHVNQAHLTSAKGRTVTLSTGEIITTDAVIFCTGWESTISKLFLPALANELGLPTDPAIVSEQETEHWKTLDATARQNIDTLYPVLRSPPKNLHVSHSPLTPIRLFRSIIPPKLAARDENNIAFLGLWINGRVQLTSELSSLWAIAYLENLFPPPTAAMTRDLSRTEKDIAHVSAYVSKRYLNAYHLRLTTFESAELDDLLLKDLEIRHDRKRMNIPEGWRGWWGWKAWKEEWFGNYTAEDYKGIRKEFLAAVEARGQKLGAKTVVNGVKED